MPKITKRTVDALVPRERDRVVWDDDIKGFGVRVHPTGKKVYIVKYRHKGKIVKTTIGPHGPITQADARARGPPRSSPPARTGKDPGGEWTLRSESTDQRDVVERFLKEYVPTHCKPGTREVYHSALEIHVVPRLGVRRVADVERGDMVALHHELRATPYQANRTIGVLPWGFTLAEVWGLRPDGSNPCRHVKRFREEKRERFLSDEEYRRLGAALKESEEHSLEPPAVVATTHLLMLPGCRKAEILTLQWGHVDLDAGELQLPDSEELLSPRKVALNYSCVGRNNPRPCPIPAPRATGPVIDCLHRMDMCRQGYFARYSGRLYRVGISLPRSRAAGSIASRSTIASGMPACRNNRPTIRSGRGRPCRRS